MLRIVLIALAVLIVWVVAVKIVKDIKAARVDWKGWAFVIGFIVLAFYLRHATGIADF